MNDDLTTWIRAQLDVDEAWALAASTPYPYAAGQPAVPRSGLHWEWVTGDDWHSAVPDPAASEYLADGDPVRLASRETWPSSTRPDDPQWQQRRTYGEDVQDMDSAAAGHIARHDPARVLREVEAKRRIVDAYEQALQAEGEWRERPVPTRPADLRLHEQEGTEVIVAARTWRRACRALAAVHADRPGYRSEWRP